MAERSFKVFKQHQGASYGPQRPLLEKDQPGNRADSQVIDQDKPEWVVIADPPTVSTPGVRNEGTVQEEKFMEVGDNET
uniref:Uncharacterized protein n=1 Tax=Romanomermis culicivorax TaxID=13658 RepID=A0A915KI14_ROMCU